MPWQHYNVTRYIYMYQFILLYVRGGFMLGLMNYGQDSVTENKHGYNKQKQTYFLICESCFWCASALSLRPIINEIIPKCPVCDDVYCISIVPISSYHQP